MPLFFVSFVIIHWILINNCFVYKIIISTSGHYLFIRFSIVLAHAIRSFTQLRLICIKIIFEVFRYWYWLCVPLRAIIFCYMVFIWNFITVLAAWGAVFRWINDVAFVLHLFWQSSQFGALLLICTFIFQHMMNLYLLSQGLVFFLFVFLLTINIKLWDVNQFANHAFMGVWWWWAWKYYVVYQRVHFLLS